MDKIATRLFKPPTFNGHSVWLYKFEPPIKDWDDNLITYAVLSSISNFFTEETYIFASNEKGDVSNWAELEGSMRGNHTHEEILKNLDYKIVIP